MDQTHANPISICRPLRLANGDVRFHMWAPLAKRVELLLGEGQSARSVPLVYEDSGYFAAEVSGLESGERYAYRLNGGQPRPDPCSLWQPAGVHRPSALYFPEQFAWTDQAWRGVPREELAFYELHVGTFTAEGTFEAIIPRLQELKELGVTAIEIMPVAQFAGARNWGYDGVHLFAAQNSYGGPLGLQKLIDAAHAHGLGVFLDVVYNHFGPEGNYAGEFGSYFSRRYNTPWGPAFNFDGPGCDAVRDFVLDNVWMWIADFHFDGLRLDAVHAMFDISPRHILGEIKQVADAAAASRGGTACIVVESLLNDVRMVLPTARGGYGADAEWNEDFHHAVLAYFTGERHGKYMDFGPAEHLPRVLNETFLLSGGYSRFRGRRWGGPAQGLPGDQFVVGIQNHDHIGNRALGERLSTLVTPAVNRLCASLMLLSPHLPFLFMGEEYGEQNPFRFFCDFSDNYLIESVRTGRRRDYDLAGELPDPQAQSTFAASRLAWAWPPGSPQAGLRQLYVDLLGVRKQWKVLRDWNNRAARLIPSDENSLVLELIRGEGLADVQNNQPKLWCYFNLTNVPHEIEAPLGQALLFSSEAAAYHGTAEHAQRPSSHLLPFECVVFGPPEYQRLAMRS